MPLRSSQKALLEWYVSVRRPLPWRENRDPYRIWISEVMLQQTTVTAVIPFYERFLERFPTLQKLAESPIESVLETWAGLGYYSRARNLHKAAHALSKLGSFPQSYQKLLELPGFGPYTARAVASIAFSEQVGVLDGNVIRVLSRYHRLAVDWWKPKGREVLQSQADLWANTPQVSDLNQAFMELGATICSPTRPLCVTCPLEQTCLARKHQQVERLPPPKPRKAKEFWIWEVDIQQNAKGQVYLTPNSYAPFLKGHWVPPGRAIRSQSKPIQFLARGSVTHHDIFIKIAKSSAPASTGKWVPVKDLEKWVHSNLTKKALGSVLGQTSRHLGILAVSLGLSFATMLGACQSKPKSSEPSRTYITPQTSFDSKYLSEPKALTQGYQHRQPRLSNDQRKLLLLSSERPDHVKPQIYELTINTMSLKRVTFLDGLIGSIGYLNPGEIIFSSDADAVKELDFAVESVKAKLGLKHEPLPAVGDLFVLSGASVRKLTSSKNQDLLPSVNGSGLLSYLTRDPSGGLELGVFDTQRKRKLGSSLDLKDSQVVDLSLSHDGQRVAWIERGPERDLLLWSEFPFQSSKKVDLRRFARLSQVAWHPNGYDLILSGYDSDLDSQTELFWVGRDGQCLQQLTQSQCRETEPQISRDGQWVFFSSDCNGTLQIYRSKILKDSECWIPKATSLAK